MSHIRFALICTHGMAVIGGALCAFGVDGRALELGAVGILLALIGVFASYLVVELEFSKGDD